MTKTRRSFTDEFKREAVKLVKQPGAKVTHIARDLGIEQSVLRRWVDQERGGVLDMRPSRPSRSEAAGEVERLQRELRRVTMERDILKKALGYFAKDPQ
jgi:transposase